ncbi:MAG TPA: hypothetical protein VH142_03620 [Polyangiaceae bacterium]|nr:hypothetical protein [Polyangiaceae bacterium]
MNAEPGSGTEASLEAVPLRRKDGKSVASPKTVRALMAIAEALFSRGGTPPPRERLEWVGREAEDFLARAGARTRILLSLLVSVVCVLAPLTIGRLARLHSLSCAERIRALGALERRFAEPLIAVKALLCLLYYEHPDGAREAGFDGECALPRGTRATRDIGEHGAA